MCHQGDQTTVRQIRGAKEGRLFQSHPKSLARPRTAGLQMIRATKSKKVSTFHFGFESVRFRIPHTHSNPWFLNTDLVGVFTLDHFLKMHLKNGGPSSYVFIARQALDIIPTLSLKKSFIGNPIIWLHHLFEWRKFWNDRFLHSCTGTTIMDALKDYDQYFTVCFDFIDV